MPFTHVEVLCTNTEDKVQRGNKKAPSSPSVTRTARGNDPLRRNLAITCLSKHSRHSPLLSITHEVVLGKITQHIHHSCTPRVCENRPEWRQEDLSAEETRENLPKKTHPADLRTYLKPSWCRRWHASYSFTFARPQVSLPSTRCSPSSSPSSGNNSAGCSSLPCQPLCLKSSLSLPPCPVQGFCSL